MVALVLLLAGCGYFQGGTWEDDAQNYKRAWGYSKPAEIEMPHSWYWRSPHFTREEVYFFQFRWQEQLFEQLKSNNQMHKVIPAATNSGPPPDYCFPKPQWFTPKPRESYEVWTGEPEVHCWLFRDLDTKEIFLYACQL